MSVQNTECECIINTITKTNSQEDMQILYCRNNTTFCNMRKIELKSDVFEGYFVWVDISKFKDVNRIIDYVKLQLLNFLKTFNLKNLVNYANKMNLQFGIFKSYEDIVKYSKENDSLCLYEHRDRSK